MDDDYTSKIITSINFDWSTATSSDIGVVAEEVVTIDPSIFNVEVDFKWLEDYEEDEFWRKVRKEAKTNQALQHAIERVKILYHLSKDEKDPPPLWHPV